MDFFPLHISLNAAGMLGVINHFIDRNMQMLCIGSNPLGSCAGVVPIQTLLALVCRLDLHS